MSHDASAELLRILCVNFVNFGAFEAEEIRSRSWWSGTFCGIRHEVGFRVAGEDARRGADIFLDGLEDREFALRGHFVADIRLMARDDLPDGVRLRLEALTVELD